MKNTFQEQVAEIKEVIANNRWIGDRIAKLSDLGYEMTSRAMGSGGVGQLKGNRTNTFVQIGCGRGRGNVAMVVVLALCTEKV